MMSTSFGWKHSFRLLIPAFFSLSLLHLNQVYGQEIWDFPVIEVAEGEYLITDTIYMAPDGNDSNSGSFDSPVASFGKAISLLPFGEAGVNGGHAYGLIMLHSGVYQVTAGFQQNPNQYESNGTFKNVSIEGIGNVTVQGGKTNYESLADGHMIHLIGSHIYIRNVKLKFAKLHGILLAASHRMTIKLCCLFLFFRITHCRFYKAGKKRVRIKGTAFQFRMKLHSDKPWVIIPLNNFRQPAVRGKPGEI